MAGAHVVTRRGNGRTSRLRPAKKLFVPGLLLGVAVLVAVAGLRRCFVTPSQAQPRAAAAVTSSADSEEYSLPRRDVAGVAGLAAGLAALGAPPLPASARIEGVRENPDEFEPVTPGKIGSRVQRMLVSLADNEAMDKEIKFWTEACKMKVLSDAPNDKKERTVVIGFAPETAEDGAPFALELKVDPVIKTRKTPRTLNYDVMQPTVNAVNFVQVSAKGKVIDMFSRVQASGGSSLIGDQTYLDAESPRGVPVRLVKRDREPQIDLLCFNIEVPAFIALTNLYQKGFGMEEVKYPATEPPIQQRSIYLSSPIGGPKLLLSPVPDGRLKERELDETEAILFWGKDAAALSKQVENTVVQVAEAQRLKDIEDEKEREKYRKKGEPIPPLLLETQARPTFNRFGEKDMSVDDGLGNILLVSDKVDFVPRTV